MAEFMTGLKRTHYCGDLRISDVGSEVTVCGWVQRVRDLGQLIFLSTCATARASCSSRSTTRPTARFLTRLFRAAANLCWRQRALSVSAAPKIPTFPPATLRSPSPTCACSPRRRPLPLRSWTIPKQARTSRGRPSQIPLSRPAPPSLAA